MRHRFKKTLVPLIIALLSTSAITTLTQATATERRTIYTPTQLK